ncbi:MAG: ABC transporter substrate-binding protein [Chloroflexota bacterium]
MKLKLTLLATLVATLVAACGGTAPTAPTSAPAAPTPAKLILIGMVQQAPLVPLDSAAKGVIDVLKENGYEDGKNIKIDRQNAAGDIPALASIAKKFKDDKVDFVVAIGTLPTQNVFAVFKDTTTPIFFSTVTDPYAAGVAKSPTDKGDNITGIQASPPVEEAFKLILEIAPKVKKVGIIWTPTEKNSEVATGRAKEIAKTLNVEVLEATVSKADEVLAAAQSLASKKVDAFFISTDVTVVSALESVVKVANESKIPLFGNDPDSAKRGAVCALGLDYYDNGRNSGLQLVKALKGQAKAKDMPIEAQKKGYLACNLPAAQQQGATIPDAVLKRADVKY